MKRVASQLTFCSPDKILRRAVVERNEQNIVTQLFSLDEGNVEATRTLFFDGILSAEIVSLKQNNQVDMISCLYKDYQYLDLTINPHVIEIVPTRKPLVLDFGTNQTNVINIILQHSIQALSAFTIFDIIAACTYYPSLLIGGVPELTVNRFTRLMLWEDVDMINKTLIASSHVREII